MRLKKKLLVLAALLAAAVLILTGCSEPAEQVSSAKPTEFLELAEPAPEQAADRAPEKPTEAPTKAPKAKATEAPTEEPGPIIEPQAIADYIFEHGELPDNFITKDEAKALGWDSSKNYVSDVAPGKSIGGDYFGNYEGQLPKAKGRKFHECDCNYTGGKRGAERIIYSNDGHVWYTNDHYGTFTELFPSNSP